MKILTVLGARPQFIKAAMVSREILKKGTIEEIIVHTGQHFDENMSAVFFEEMGIPQPKYNLGISGGGHGAMTGRMMIELEKVFGKEQPELVLVYGDTNSTLAAALVARKLNIPLAHVEGGLRNFDMTVPEDVNRIVTDRLSNIIFYPTDSAHANLVNEGFDKMPVQLVRTGDLMYDAMLYYSELPQECKILDELCVRGLDYLLSTIHRAHNTEAPGIYETFAALNTIAEDNIIVLPIHPRTKQALTKHSIALHSNIKVIDAQGYLNMVCLMKNASVIITDSGGIQKEAFALKKKSFLLMDFTPWDELVTHGYSVVTRISVPEILMNWDRLKKMNPEFNIQLYGDGDSAGIIIQKLIEMSGGV